MDAFLYFFIEAWRDFVAEENQAAQLGIAATMLSVSLLPMLGLLITLVRARSRAGQVQRLEEALRFTQTQRDKAKKEADEQRALADLWMPERWLIKAKAEREQGNEELAIDAIEIGFDNVSDGLGIAARQLAFSYAGRVIEGSILRDRAERFARLALLLRPSDAELAFLLDDLSAVDESVFSDLEDIAELPSDPARASTLLDVLVAKYHELFANGRYRLCVGIARRGVLASKRAGLFDQSEGFVIRYYECDALFFSGRSAEAMEKVTDLLSVWERVQGGEHPNVLNTRHLEAQLLRDLGRSAEALEKVTDLLPIRERVEGGEHPNVLNTQHLEAQLLNNLGQSAEALEKVTNLLSVRDRVQGGEHPDVLSTQHLEAQLLNDLGRSAEALEKVTDLLPIRERVHGSEHPDVLDTRHLEAQLLRDLGRSSEALEKVTDLLPIEERVRGSEHPDVLNTRYLEAQLLRDLGRSAEALEKVTDLLPIRERVEGGEHPNVLNTQHLEAQLLRDLGQSAEALEKVTNLLSVRERVEGGEHPSVLPARHLEVVLLRDLGRSAEALEKVTDLLPAMERMEGGEHPDVLMTKVLLAEVQTHEGDAVSALDNVTDLILLLERLLGSDHWYTLRAGYVRLLAESELGRGANVIASLEKLRERLLAATRPEHPNVQDVDALLSRLRDDG